MLSVLHLIQQKAIRNNKIDTNKVDMGKKISSITDAGRVFCNKCWVLDLKKVYIFPTKTLK